MSRPARSPTAIAVLMAHFQRHFQHFASRENTRYEWLGPAIHRSIELYEGEWTLLGTILSSSASFL